MRVVDRSCADPDSKLFAQELKRPEGDDSFFSALCDPAEPFDWDSLQDAIDGLFDSDSSLVKGAARRVGQRLGVVDVEGGAPREAT
jgi:hypothetical protein